MEYERVRMEDLTQAFIEDCVECAFEEKDEAEAIDDILEYLTELKDVVRGHMEEAA
jgi:hypothetical protein